MHRFILALSCILMMLAAPISAQDFQKGYEAYQNGDYATALKEWTPLAEGGNSDARYNLGLMYYNGWGVPQDYKEAAKWYRLGAEQGDADAQNNLGVMYDEGEGVPQDDKEAAKWFKLAAKQGYSDAQLNLGSMLRFGKGVLADYVIAHMWYNISAVNGFELGADNREKLAKEMTLEDISKAQAMARECMNSNYQNCDY